MNMIKCAMLLFSFTPFFKLFAIFNSSSGRQFIVVSGYKDDGKRLQKTHYENVPELNKTEIKTVLFR